MKQKLLKTMRMLLVAAALGVGVNAWAAPTLTNSLEVAGYKAKAYYDFTTNSPEVLPTSGDLRYRDGFGLHNYGSGNRSAVVSIPVSSGDIIIVEKYTSDPNKQTTGTATVGVSCGSVNSTITSALANDAYTCFDVTSDVTTSFNLSTVRYIGFRAALVMEVDNDAQTNAYTINYTYGGSTIKTTSATVAVGTTVYADNHIIVEDQTYLITASNIPSLTVSASGENTLNVPVRLPYSATVNVTTTIAEEVQAPVTTVFTETINKECIWRYGYSMYVEKGGKWYIVDEIGTFGESGNFTDGQVINKSVTYTNVATDVVYFEDALGKTVRDGASGGYTGVWGGDKAQTPIGSFALDAGNYEVTFYVWAKAGGGSNHRGEQLDVNGTEVVSVTGNINGERIYKFNVASDASTIDIYGKGTNKATDELDYVLIKKLPATVSATITSTTGYATFSSTYALDFSSVTGLTAYTATACDGTNVTLTPVTGTVAANTGLIIEGAADTYNIPVVATGDAQDDNLLVACSAETTVSASATGTNYVLSLQGYPAKAVFAPVTGDNATVTAGHAFLYVPSAQGGSRALNIVFAGEATGIHAIDNSRMVTDGYYNLQGQRVNVGAGPVPARQKGLYIVNGKKVVKRY